MPSWTREMFQSRATQAALRGPEPQPKLVQPVLRLIVIGGVKLIKSVLVIVPPFEHFTIGIRRITLD